MLVHIQGDVFLVKKREIKSSPMKFVKYLIKKKLNIPISYHIT